MSRFRLTSRTVSAALAVCGTTVAAYSQTAEELKRRFAEFLGSNRYARIVWQVEGRDDRKPNFDYDTYGDNPSKIMALDTKDGIVRQLAGPKSGTHYSGATFTWDGKKVIWTDNIKRQYLVSDFLDTTTRKILLNGYEGDGRCYRTSDGKNWVLATEANDYGRLFRVNIDDTTEKVLLFTTKTRRTGWAGASCWASISTHGKYVGGGFPNNGGLGWVNLTVSNPSVTYLTSNGCWPDLARDTTGDLLYCPDHKAVRILNMKQQELARPNLLTAGLLGGTSATKTHTYYESLRWTSDRDIISLYAYWNDCVNSDGTGCDKKYNTIGYPNPRLINLKTMEYVAIVDNPTVPLGNTDVYFYTGASTVSHHGPSGEPGRVIRGRRASGTVFDVHGRCIEGRTGLRSGVYLERSSLTRESRTAVVF